MDQQPQTSRLGIIHLLVWMLGCGVVLAGYRLLNNPAIYPAEVQWRMRLVQTLFGLAYGGALSGLMLLFWRRWRGDSKFPSQPGHWLLVLAGGGFLIDASVSLGLAPVRLSATPSLDWTLWYVKQVLVWGLAGLVGLVVTIVLRRTARWRWFALLSTLFLLGSAAGYAIIWQVQLGGLPGLLPLVGMQLYDWPTFWRLAGELVLPLVLLTVLWQERCQAPRDWLHWSGVTIGVALAAIDATQTVMFLW